MKKLFFNAVALVAFSSVSMGNTIAVETEFDVNTKAIDVEQKTLVVFPWEFFQTLKECVGVYNEIQAAYTPVLGSAQATAIAQGAFVGCMGLL